TSTRRSTSGNGSGRRNVALATVKTALTAATTTVTVSRRPIARPGRRANIRSAIFSCIRISGMRLLSRQQAEVLLPRPHLPAERTREDPRELRDVRHVVRGPGREQLFERDWA